MTDDNYSPPKGSFFLGDTPTDRGPIVGIPKDDLEDLHARIRELEAVQGVTDEESARDYLVWSNVHRGWWGPNNAGYRYSIRGAGLYTRDEALTIAHKARDGWHGDSPPTEIAVALADLPEQVRALTGERE